MKLFKDFIFEFVSAFENNDYISIYSPGKAVGEFIKISIPPFLITAILGLSTLFATKKWDSILFSARNEFVQVTGLKLSFYTVLLLVAFSFVFYRISFLTSILSWLVRSISNIGFVISSVLLGTTFGMLVFDSVNPKVSNSTLSIISFCFLLLSLSTMFYLSARVFSDGIRNEIDETLGKYKWVFTLVFGLILGIIWWFGVNDEPWIEVSRQ